MTVTQSLSKLPSTVVLGASHQGLQLDSTLAELPRHHCQISAEVLGQAIAQMFQQHPLLPGAILMADGQFLGSLSRQRFLEVLLHPQGSCLFLSQPLSVLHSYTRHSSNLILPVTTTIVVAAQLALRRSPQERNEPIVVQLDAHTYHLLDVHELN
ncbi:MAG TPA: ATP-binding protein, partial [Coleofasciculaceae cyanobacterium]